MVVVVAVQTEDSPGMLNHVTANWRWAFVGGASVGVAWFHVHINLQLKSATTPMEAKTERGIFCYLHCSKIIEKGEMEGM